MKSVRRALLARFITFPVSAVATFLTTSLVISHAGASVYGVVMLVASVFALIPFADLGTGAAVVETLSGGRHDRSSQQRLLRTVFRWLLISSCVLVLLAVSGTFLWSWGSLFGLNTSKYPELDAATACSVGLFALSVPASIGQRVLLGLSKNDAVVLLSATTAVFTLGITWTLVQIGVSNAFLATATPAGILLSQFISAAVALRSLRMPLSELIFGPGGRSREVLGSAAPMALMLITLPLALQGHRIIVSRSLDVSKLADYTLAMQLYSPLWSFVSAAGASLWPLFASQRGQRRELRRTVGLSSAMFSGGALAGATGLVVLGGIFSGWISHGQIVLTPWLLASTGLMLFVQTAQQVPGMFLTTSAGLRLQSVWTVCMAVVALGLSAVLTPRYGPTMPFLATSFAVLTCQVIPGAVKIRAVIRGAARHRDSSGQKPNLATLGR